MLVWSFLLLYSLYHLLDWRRWTGRWSWHLWLDDGVNTSRWALWHQVRPPDFVPPIKLQFPPFWCSGGRRSLLRGWLHCGQWRKRTWLADEAQREAVAAGKNVWQLLSSWPCISHHRCCARWEQDMRDELNITVMSHPVWAASQLPSCFWNIAIYSADWSCMIAIIRNVHGWKHSS